MVDDHFLVMTLLLAFRDLLSHFKNLMTFYTFADVNVVKAST